MKKNMILVGLIALLLGCTGCMKSYYSGTFTLVPDTFERIENANLKLSIIGSRQLFVGIDDSVTFKLENLGEDISVPEWQVKDIDNLVLYYQDWLPGTQEPDPKAWIKIEPIVLEPIQRYPLFLSKGATVLIRAGLPFLEGLEISSGKERRFFIKAKLNLKSVYAESEVYGISVM